MHTSRLELYTCNKIISPPTAFGVLTGGRGKITTAATVVGNRKCLYGLVDSRIELNHCQDEPTMHATVGILTGGRGKLVATVADIAPCIFQIPDLRFELPQLFTARRHVPPGRLVVNPVVPLSNRLKTAFVANSGRIENTLDERTHDNALSLFLSFSCNDSPTRFEANNIVAIYNEQNEPILALDLVGIGTDATQPDVVRVRSHIITNPPSVDVLLTPTTMGGQWYEIGVTLDPISANETAIFVTQGGRSKIEVGTFSSIGQTSWKTEFAPGENVNITAAYTWDRVLSDAEHWQLSEQPFGIWLPD